MLKWIQRWLIEWGALVAIIMLIIMFTWQGISISHNTERFHQQALAFRTAQSQTNAAIEAQAKADAVIAKADSCKAVRLSDNATIAFIQKQIAVTFQKNKLASEAFVANLSASYAAAEVQCLTGG